MLHLTIGSTSNIVVTLQEKTTIVDPYYLFVFTHLTTKQQVRFVMAPADDLTSDANRYNEYEIDVPTLFPAATEGQYRYQVFESSTSTDDETGLLEVESGKMKLHPATDFAFTKYNTTTNYKVYEG